MVFLKSLFIAGASFLIMLFALGFNPIVAAIVASGIQFTVSRSLEGDVHVSA